MRGLLCLPGMHACTSPTGRHSSHACPVTVPAAAHDHPLRAADAAADEARNKKRRRQVLDSSSLREELQGSEVEVYWPDDATWWAAKLTKVGGALEPGSCSKPA